MALVLMDSFSLTKDRITGLQRSTFLLQHQIINNILQAAIDISISK